MRALLIIPAYNEAASLAAVVADVRAYAPSLDILVVDDASTDSTPALLPGLGVRWIRLSQRLGTGAAVRTALRYAHTRGYRVVVRIDGDGQHPAQEIPKLLDRLHSDRLDAVIGSRYAGQAAVRPGWRRASHYLLGRILTGVTGRTITDPTSGFWAFGPVALRLLVEHHPSGYPEPELLLFLARNGLRFGEVSVHMRPRLGGVTSLTPPRTGAALARMLLLLVVVPLRAAVGVK
jgi:glycosyltransferase involved in cell wall biosynthesis